jgi:peptidyl-prolyl cis-trans isomerase B (cyclophilin B)
MNRASSAVFLALVLVLTASSCTKRVKCDHPKHEGESMEAVIDTKFGKIVFEFLPKVAPKTVANFQKLAESCFYDGTTFHRVIPGFMIQGGDPNSKSKDRSQHGVGGPGYTIKAEFSREAHTRGAVSMARSADPDSAGSQFFVVVNDAPHLDTQYTLFGRVKEGMDVVDKIVSVPRDSRDNPNDRVEMKVTLR